MLKKLMASWTNFAYGRIIVERLLEMSRHPPVGTTSGSDDADDEPERKQA
jgi:hypothetical protein